MPKSKLNMSHSTEDPSANGTVAPLCVVPEKTSDSHSVNTPSETCIDAGRLPEEVYTNTLPGWRAELRRKCVEVVEWESEIIATCQVLLSSRGQVRRKSSSSSSCFPGSCSVALARHVFCAHFDAWHAYILSRLSSRVFLFWVR